MDDAVVGLVDIFPTILDLLGIEDPVARDGLTLRLSRQESDRALYMETMAAYLDNGWAPLHALRRHREKYIFAPRPEYYDLAADPDERRNLFDGERRADLAGELAARLKEGASTEDIAAGAEAPDPESLKSLQALGYLSGAGRAATEEALPDPKDMVEIRNSPSSREA